MKTPLYYRIYCSLRERIESQEFKSGDLLPTEPELERLFGSSRSPVRQALSLLESEGLIVRRPGKGTFVAFFDEEMELWLNFSPFRRHFRKGKNKTVSRTLSVTAEVPPDYVKDFFGLGKSQKVTCVERVRRTEDGRPVLANRHYVSPQYDVEKILGEGNFSSLRSLMMEKYLIKVTRIEDVLTAVCATPRLAEILEVPEGNPLLALRRNVFTEKIPMMLDVVHAVTEIWDYRVTFEEAPNGKVAVMISK